MAMRGDDHEPADELALEVSDAPSREFQRFRIRDREGGDRSSTSQTNFVSNEFRNTCVSIIRDMGRRLPGLESVRLTNDFPELQHWRLEDEQSLESAKRRRVEAMIPADWNSLPFDLQDNILQRVDFKDLCRCKASSRANKERIESDAFCEWRGATSLEEGSFTAISYYIRNSEWRCSGYDMGSNSWRSLPTLSYLPPPEKQFSVSGHRSLMCGHVSKLPNKGELLVFNPLTGRKRALPPLLNPRTPVLVHISVDSGGKSYTVVVAGSSSVCDKHLSKKVEVFSSTTSKWAEASDVPEPVFGLIEHQAGVCINGVLYVIALFVVATRPSHKGVVAFDVKNGTWLEKLTCPIPFWLSSNTVQLVECNGKLHLFSEQEREYCIDVLESAREGTWHWRNVVRVKRCYRRRTCVSFGEGRLCVLNTQRRDGAVYDMRDGKQVAALPPPPANQKGKRFFTMNPASFTLQPRFDTNPGPPI